MTPVALRTIANIIASGGLLTGLVFGFGTFRRLAHRSEESRREAGRFRCGTGGGR